jgi:hypothetical protein
MRSSRERVRCSCLNRWFTQRELKSSLKNKNQDLNLREREESLSFWSQGSFSIFEWPTALGGRWEYIYSPHLKRVIGRIFHRTCLVEFSTSRSYTGQVRSIRLIWYHHRTSMVGFSGSRSEASRSWPWVRQVWSTRRVRWRDQTSLVPAIGVRSKLSGSQWIHRTSSVKPENRFLDG